MDGLARAIGAPVPIEFNGETLLLDGINFEDFGTVEQRLLSEKPNPLDLARPQAVEFIKLAADYSWTANRTLSQISALESREKRSSEETEALERLRSELEKTAFVRDEFVAMAEKIMADARRAASIKNKIPRREVAEWIDTTEGLAFSVWLKFHQRYPGRFSEKDIQKIVTAMTIQERVKLHALRDQASGFDDLGNSTGPTPLEKATIGPTGE